MTEPLSPQDIAARLAAVRGGVQAQTAQEAVVIDERSMQSYKYLRPLSEAGENLIDTVQNSDGRYMFGLTEIDTRMRGVGNGEMCVVVGYSHSGKTQLVLSSVLHNRTARILFFTMDEPAELVLMKLACMHLGLSAEDMEQLIKDGDSKAIGDLRRVARKEFPNLIVIDAPLNLGQMHQCLQEAEDFWGGECQVIVFDYLNLLRCDADDVEGKSEALKGWIKEVDRPGIVIHQGGRGASGKGQVITMTSGKYGGEQEAIFLIGVRRKRDDESLDVWERERLKDTVSISIVKNKRPPCKLTAPEGVDFYLNPDTGFIRPLHGDDIGVTHVTYTHARDALAARDGVMPGQLEAFA